MKKGYIKRRTFLRGIGTAMALPLFEGMVPGLGQIANAAGKSASGPTRMAFVYFPNGAIMPKWHVKGEGKNYEMSETLKALEPHRDTFQIFKGFLHDKARANGDGAGDHARANAVFLTGQQPRKTASDLKVGQSIDQLAADKIGGMTPLPSLELSCDRPRTAGACDSGYACAYQHNLSWRDEDSPVPAEVDPRLAFDRLFSNGVGGEVAENRARRDRYNKSILDFVQEDARSLGKHLGRNDQTKLSEYMDSVRDIERRIERSTEFNRELPDYPKPDGVPQSYAEHMRLMYDILALAFQTDTTRISSFLLGHDGSNRSFRDIGVSEGHHSLSHHSGDQNKISQIEKIDKYYVENFAYFLDKLKNIPEGDGNLLDNCMIVYGSGHSDANRHWHHDLPIIVAGGGSGTLNPGRTVDLKQQVPLCNLYLSMLDRMGIKEQRFGDSTGEFKQL